VNRDSDSRVFAKGGTDSVPPLVLYATGVVLAVSVVIAWLFPMEATDTLCRYAPMAEAFAAGNWGEAFHPRFAIGGSVIAGILAALPGFDGLTACTVSATCAWALGIIPVYGLANRMFGARAAMWSMILYIIAPQPALWAFKGLREPFKMLGILCAADVLICRRREGWGLVVEGCLAMVLLCMFKCDGILLALLFFVAYAVRDKFGFRTLTLAGTMALALVPMCLLVHYRTGYWLPAPQYVGIWQRLFGV